MNREKAKEVARAIYDLIKEVEYQNDPGFSHEPSLWNDIKKVEDSLANDT